MDRVTKVALIIACWIVIFSNLLFFHPAMLGSWSAGIDLRTHTIITTGQLSPQFYFPIQSVWFQQASSDPVYGIYFATYAIVGGATTLQGELSVLSSLPPSLPLYVVASVAIVRLLKRRATGELQSAILTGSIMLFLFPASRFHVLLLGYAGNALAPAVMMLVLWTFARLVLIRPRDWRLILVAMVESFVLINTYHTWANYFAIITTAILIYAYAPRVKSTLLRKPLFVLLLLGPIFWMFTALFTGTGSFYTRFATTIQALKAYDPPQLGLNLFFPEAGPLASFTRAHSAISAENFPTVIASMLFVGFFLGSVAILVRRKRRGDSGKELADFGVGLFLGVIGTVTALYILGGTFLVLGRGFEPLSVVGPITIDCAVLCYPTGTSPLAVRKPGSPCGHSKRKAIATISVLFLLLIAANTVASLERAYRLDPDEMLNPVEAQAVLTTNRFLDPQAVIWSDHRLAPAFLFTQPREFVTFDLAYNQSKSTDATVAAFYGDNCDATERYVRGTGATIAITTSYMEEVGVVTRTIPLAPATSVSRCLGDLNSKIYDNREVSSYLVAPSP